MKASTVCTWHRCMSMYCALCRCYCMPLGTGLIPTMRAYNTCIWSLGINFPLVKFYLHLPRFCTHRDESKSCRKRRCSFRICCRGRLILTLDVPSLPLCVSLFLPFYTCSLFFSPLFFPPSLPVKGKRWHLGYCSASTVSSFLFFIEGGGVCREQERQRETKRSWVSSPPSLRLFSLISTSCPLLSHRTDLHSSPSFPVNSPFFLPSFLLIFACPSL